MEINPIFSQLILFVVTLTQMKKSSRLVLAFFVVTNFYSYSQMINNQFGQAFTAVPFFNSEFILQNKIKKLKGFYSITSPTTSVIQTGLYCSYEFDEKGRLIHTLETFQGTERKDSLESFYEYNEQNQLIKHRKKEYKGYTTIINVIDSKGNIVKQTYNRDVLNEKDEVIESYLISEETMKFESSPFEEKQTVYNNYNLPYLEIIKKYDSNKYLIEETERSITTSNYYKTTYSYNDRGWLESKKKFTSSNENPVEETTFKYDAFGNVKNIFQYSFGDLKEEKEVYYNDKTLILSNMLVIDPKSKRVKILQFKEKSFFK
jgi:hypothetical protein